MVLGSHSPIHTWNIYRQRLVEVSLSSGNYSRLLADVIFTRSMGYYMIQVIWGYFRILHDTGSFWIFRDIIWYRWVLTIVLREENWENNIPKGTKGPGIQCLDSFDWFNLITNLCYRKREYFAQKWFSTSTCKRIDQEWRSAKKVRRTPILPVFYISLIFAGSSTVFGSLLAGRSGAAEPAADGETRRLLSRLHPIHTSLPT